MIAKSNPAKLVVRALGLAVFGAALWSCRSAEAGGVAAGNPPQQSSAERSTAPMPEELNSPATQFNFSQALNVRSVVPNDRVHTSVSILAHLDPLNPSGRADVRALKQLSTRFADDDVQVLAIVPAVNQTTLVREVTTLGIEFPITVASPQQAPGLATVELIDKAHRMRYRWSGGLARYGANGTVLLANLTHKLLAERMDVALAAASHSLKGDDNMTDKIVKTDAEWKAELTPEQYDVLRHAGTEAPFTGPLLSEHEKGTFVCAGCGNPLFSSDTKFDSGTGWPSFWQPLSATSVEQRNDGSDGMRRTEIVCQRCGGHLGHVFDDGPAPTGLRYCMNSAALQFVAAK